MANPRSMKRDIERARQEKAAAKRERRLVGADVADGDDPTDTGGARRSQDEVLAGLAALHDRFEQRLMSFEDFEAARSELTGQLHVN